MISAGGIPGTKTLSFTYGTGQADQFTSAGDMKLEFVLEKHAQGSNLICTCNVGDA